MREREHQAGSLRDVSPERGIASRGIPLAERDDVGRSSSVRKISASPCLQEGQRYSL